MRKNLDYIIFILLLAFTTFEYFFREDILAVAISLFAIGVVVYKGLYRNYNMSYSIIAICAMLMWSLIQSALIPWRSLVQPILLGISLFGAMSIAMIVKDRFVSIFVTTMYYIAIVALVIYLLCLDPTIQSFLIHDLTQNFTSLNVETAMIEGGGKNFIIHNFVAGDNVLEATDMLRNCGPFWEPGMFAVFLSIALFLHNIVERQQQLRFCNLILVAALVSTFSTGGYICGLLVLLFYVITSRNNYFISAIGIIVFVVLVRYFWQLEFVGEKLIDQSEDIELGTDYSRFSAFFTQIEMIKNSPVLGGERISDYLQDKDAALASGTLLPFVQYGIPIGFCYMMIILRSLVGLVRSKGQKMIAGVVFFLLLLFLSFSQTILLSLWMQVVIFVGLITYKTNSYNMCKTI